MCQICTRALRSVVVRTPTGGIYVTKRARLKFLRKPFRRNINVAVEATGPNSHYAAPTQEGSNPIAAFYVTECVMVAIHVLTLKGGV